jgi:hypothetical protein
MTKPLPIIIDTDPVGRRAILLALASPELEFWASAVAGSIPRVDRNQRPQDL